MTEQEVYKWLDRPADLPREERLVALVVHLSQEVDRLQIELLEADLAKMPTTTSSVACR